MTRKELIEKLKLMNQEKKKAEIIRKRAFEELEGLNKEVTAISEKINDVNLEREEIEFLVEAREEIRKKINVVNVEIQRANKRIEEVIKPETLKKEFYEIVKETLIEQRKEQLKTTKKILTSLKKHLETWDQQPEFIELEPEEQELLNFFCSKERNYYDPFRTLKLSNVALLNYANDQQFNEFKTFIMNLEHSIKCAEKDFWTSW